MAEEQAQAPGYSLSDLARLCGRDRATVAKRLKDLTPMPGAKGAKLFALEGALPAILDGESTEMDVAKLRKVQAEAELKELEVAIERADYLPVKEVESQRVKECQWLYQRLIAQLPREISAQLYKAESAAQIAEILKHDLGRILNEWRET